MRRCLVVSLALLAIVRSPAVAQTCMGMASFSSGPVQVGGNAQFASGANRFGASVAYGMRGGIYAGADVGTTSYDGLDASIDFGANLGYQMQMGKAQICPAASVSYDNGPDSDANGLNSSTKSAAFGVNIGTPLGTSRMQIVPNAGIGLVYSKAKVELTGFGSGEGSDTYGVAQLGLGMVFNQSIAVRPSVSIPLGLGNSDATFGVSVGFNFGK
jgi:hypothetical protein